LGNLNIRGDKVFQTIKTLSICEKSKVSLAKIILSDVNLLILEDRKFVFLLLMIFTPFPQISALKVASPLMIHTKNTSSQQEPPRKEKTSENQSNSATQRIEISLTPELED